MAAALTSSGDPLHFERCLVQILVGGQHSGTGFFVAPGRVLTCAHVVLPERETGIVWKGRSFPARILARLPDLPMVDPLGPPPDHFRTAGFTAVLERGAADLTP